MRIHASVSSFVVRKTVRKFYEKTGPVFFSIYCRLRVVSNNDEKEGNGRKTQVEGDSVETTCGEHRKLETRDSLKV